MSPKGISLALAAAGAASIASLLLHPIPADGPNPPLPTSRWIVGRPPTQSLLVLEVARTAEQKRIGLSRRKSPGQADGMAFPEDGVTERSFWMHETAFPLDIAYVGPAGTVIRTYERAAARSDRLMPSGGPVSLVIEVPAGRARLYGLVPGTPVTKAE